MSLRDLKENELDAISGTGMFNSPHEFGDAVFAGLGAGIGGALGTALCGPFCGAFGAYAGGRLTAELFNHTHRH